MLCHLEVGDDAATQRTYGFHVLVVGTAIHALGLFTDGNDFVVVAVVGDDGGFVDDDLVVIYHDGVGSAKVHCYFTVEE